MQLPHRTIICNDLHIPFEDSHAVRIFKDYISKTQPNIIILNGDILDCFELSSFDKSPRTGKVFQEELDMTKGFLEDVRKRCPKAHITYIEGNHEWRVKKYLLKNAKELSDMPQLRLPSLLGFKALKIQWVETNGGRWMDTFVEVGDWFIGHFNKVSQNSAYTCKGLVEKYGVNIIQGHCHRGGLYYKTLITGKVLQGVENYCLCDLRPTYIQRPNWQQGFCELVKEDNKLRLILHEI